MRPFALISSGVLVALLAACGGDSGDDDSGTSGGTNEGPAPANAVFAIKGAALLGAAENGAMTAVEGGDVLVAARGSGAELLITRLGPDGEARWAKTVTVAGTSDLPSQVIVAGQRAYVLAESQSVAGIRLFEVDVATGALLRAREYSECRYPVRGAALGDGGLVISCPANSGGTFLRLDSSLAVQWAKQGHAGGDVVVLPDGGYAFVGIASSLTPVNPQDPRGPQVGTGAALQLVDAAGTSRGWTFMGPGPGTHSLGGVRLLPNGKFLVAVGVESTRADAVVSLRPLALATFNADGSAGTMQSVDVTAKDTDGREVSLQFGGAYSLVSRPKETWVGFVANSGRLGSDVRGSVVARFDLGGAVTHVVHGGVITAPTTGGAALMFNLGAGELSLTRSVPADSTCVTPLAAEIAEVKPFLDKKSAAETVLTDLVVTAKDAVTTVADVTLTTSAGVCAVQP